MTLLLHFVVSASLCRRSAFVLCSFVMRKGSCQVTYLATLIIKRTYKVSPGGQIWNQCEWHHLVAKFVTNASRHLVAKIATNTNGTSW